MNDFDYQFDFLALGAICLVLLGCQPTRRTVVKANSDKDGKAKTAGTSKHPQRDFYLGYGLAMGADWIQGPYFYSLYQDEHGIAPSLVSALFTTGFLSGAVSAYFVGAMADKYGRRSTCVAYCLLYALSCILTVIPSIPLLFLGRILGGVSTSILFSVFDSWLVTDFKERKLVEKGCDLSTTYGTMSTINSVTAIASGLFSEVLVWATGTKKSPFFASAALLCLAMQLIRGTWHENYGTSATADKTNSAKETSLIEVFKRPSILALVLATTFFEGTMYLFVFFWVPALKAAQESASELPYGFIFASFMASVMAASLTFNIVMRRRVVRYSRLLVALLVLTNFVFIKLSAPQRESTTFWLFCLFEACVGLYWPTTGYLKGRLIEDGVRAKVYSAMRVPLNIFVMASLLLTRDSGNFIRVFSTCSMLLTAAFGAVWAASFSEAMP